MTTKQRVYVGIDPGVKTGMAVWLPSSKSFLSIETTKIVPALLKVHELTDNYNVIVIIEDARLVRFNIDTHKAQGAGSVKRDVGIWEETLKDWGIEAQFKRPNKAITKLSAKVFAQYTRYKGATSSHARDAAMLVYNI